MLGLFSNFSCEKAGFMIVSAPCTKVKSEQEDSQLALMVLPLLVTSTQGDLLLLKF